MHCSTQFIYSLQPFVWDFALQFFILLSDVFQNDCQFLDIVESVSKIKLYIAFEKYFVIYKQILSEMFTIFIWIFRRSSASYSNYSIKDHRKQLHFLLSITKFLNNFNSTDCRQFVHMKHHVGFCSHKLC